MNTKSAAAAVVGARHLRVGRNGQDAAAAWARGELGAAVVCDGCGSGVASEVGARLGAQLVIAELARALAAGADAADLAMWRAVRAAVVSAIGGLVERMDRDRERALHDQFLFTIVAAARSGERVAVWAVGDGAYAIGDRETVLGPFADNEPPYVAYDLLGAAPPAQFATAHASCGQVLVATDGVADVGIAAVLAGGSDQLLAHPDALRRRLALLARPDERIDWDARRAVRTPARMQDDGALALLRWS